MARQILGLKVLGWDMRACNNDVNRMQYEVGKWVSVKGKIVICENGLHLTFNSQGWKGCRVFLAETNKVHASDEDKFVCRRIRLLRELSDEELQDYEAKEKLLRHDCEAKVKAKIEALWKDYKEDYKAKVQLLLQTFKKGS